MKEVRFHGRGGQGVVTTSKILTSAFARMGKFGASFPMFGFERRGAPVTAFGRFNDKPVREKTQIYHPDIIVVLDPSQKDSPAIFQGLSDNGVMLINHPDSDPGITHENLSTLGVVDANRIALEEIGLAIPNTCIAGAFAALTGMLDFDYIADGLSDYFDANKLEANIKCARRGFEELKIINF